MRGVEEQRTRKCDRLALVRDENQGFTGLGYAFDDEIEILCRESELLEMVILPHRSQVLEVLDESREFLNDEPVLRFTRGLYELQLDLFRFHIEEKDR